MKSLSSSRPAAQQFIAQVNRILVEGSARQESDQEMTGKIAHAASASNLPSQAGTSKSCSRQFFFLCALLPAYQLIMSFTECTQVAGSLAYMRFCFAALHRTLVICTVSVQI